MNFYMVHKKFQSFYKLMILEIMDTVNNNVKVVITQITLKFVENVILLVKLAQILKLVLVAHKVSIYNIHNVLYIVMKDFIKIKLIELVIHVVIKIV